MIFFDIADSSDDFTESGFEATITTRPVYSGTITNTSLGLIGVAINGAHILQDYEDFERGIMTQNFTFTPPATNRTPQNNEGRAHIYVNDVKPSRVYGN